MALLPQREDEGEGMRDDVGEVRSRKREMREEGSEIRCEGGGMR